MPSGEPGKGTGAMTFESPSVCAVKVSADRAIPRKRKTFVLIDTLLFVVRERAGFGTARTITYFSPANRRGVLAETSPFVGCRATGDTESSNRAPNGRRRNGCKKRPSLRR